MNVTLWWTNILPWKITIFNGKIHYKWPFSIAKWPFSIANPTRVSSVLHQSRSGHTMLVNAVAQDARLPGILWSIHPMGIREFQHDETWIGFRDLFKPETSIFHGQNPWVDPIYPVNFPNKTNPVNDEFIKIPTFMDWWLSTDLILVAIHLLTRLKRMNSEVPTWHSPGLWGLWGLWSVHLKCSSYPSKMTTAQCWYHIW